MDADQSRSQASLPSPTWIFSAPFNLLLTLSQSLIPASIWGPGSSLLTGSLLRLFSGTHTHPMAPAGVDLRLCYGSSSSSPRPARIRSRLRKNQPVSGRAGGWQLSVGEWRTRLQEGLRDREGGCNQSAPWKEEKISEIQTRKKWKGMWYWRIRAKKTRLMSQTLCE